MQESCLGEESANNENAYKPFNKKEFSRRAGLVAGVGFVVCVQHALAGVCGESGGVPAIDIR
jgi:hypothetical protein